MNVLALLGVCVAVLAVIGLIASLVDWLTTDKR